MRLYSTLQRQLVELPPPPGPVGIYVCGPTVYQRIHVGNARPYVIFLWLKRWLIERGYTATLVSNITDVNDKIYVAAPGHSAELAEQASRWYVEDTDRLGLGRPDAEPKATTTMAAIVALIAELVGRGYAYEASGDVYFRVGRYGDYGQLSGQKPDQVEEQEPSALKKDPRDFALWKTTKAGEDTSWESPWGKGRPGWHIECSAMAAKLLGPAFEIHGGGLDLVFPHHENELAQSRAAGQEFAHIWMHNGLLRLTGEKMSKSLGNIQTLGQVLDEWGRETLLLFFMTAHWRSPIDFSPETMEAAREQAWTFRNAFLHPPEQREARGWDAFETLLDDDFSTTEALALMHEWRAAGQLELLRRGLGVFGLESLAEAEQAPAELEELASRRLAARAIRDFAEADRLRDEIAAAGWEVRDVAAEPGYQLVKKD
ncbi:MAG: cysteine--tRNA ligase [Gaiellaceae bacterium]|jgi:cysteinyl-tRNA synthetase